MTTRPTSISPRNCVVRSASGAKKLLHAVGECSVSRSLRSKFDSEAIAEARPVCSVAQSASLVDVGGRCLSWFAAVRLGRRGRAVHGRAVDDLRLVARLDQQQQAAESAPSAGSSRWSAAAAIRVVSAAPVRNQRYSGPNMTTSSSARNSGSRKLAITWKNRPAITSRMTTSTTSETIRAMIGPPESGLLR